MSNESYIFSKEESKKIADFARQIEISEEAVSFVRAELSLSPNGGNGFTNGDDAELRKANLHIVNEQILLSEKINYSQQYV